MLRNRRALLACICCCLAAVASAQEQTIPEILASTTHDVGSDIGVQFGILPTLDSLIGAAEVAVRGRASSPQALLSADQKLLYSDYAIVEAEVLHDPNGLIPNEGPPSLTFRQVGGTIDMYGYRYILNHANLPTLEPQQEYLFLLKRVESHFEAAGLYFGVFEFRDGKLTSIGSDGFAPELNDLTADEAVAHILNRIKAVRR